VQEIILLWIIAIQGFAVCYFEYDVWRMNRDRYLERATWREQKRKQAAKKSDTNTSSPAGSINP
jgi:hypothetical protein